MPTNARPASILPPDRAFVVQLSSDAELGEQRFVGRVEHVTTGQSVHFESLDELLAFIGRLLSCAPQQG